MNPFSRFMDPEAGRKKEEKKQFMHKAKETFMQLLSEPAKALIEDVTVSEMVCGDPECSPVDTIFRIIYKDAPMKMFGMPMEVNEVDQEALQEFMPTAHVLEGWGRGEEHKWPPLPDPGEPPEVDLRFNIDDRVECRIGPTKWAPGTVIKHWYREAGWATGHFAPYQIQLDTGKRIFAPKDVNEVIRAYVEPEPEPATEGTDTDHPQERYAY
mmetsp:Transcript_30461/g.81946  ORF Transcript_30461/g.81946 Transcript_30461/m.81946 type:complete len:212 (+) Transcript_30461:81-716(+)